MSRFAHAARTAAEAVSAWDVWQLDASTLAFIAWWIWFLAWETVAIMGDRYEGTWTAHFRPVFTEHPLSWFVGVGFYLWFGIHIFVPKLELWLSEMVKFRV